MSLDLLEILGDLTPQQIREAVLKMAPEEAQAILDALDMEVPGTPLEEAQRIDEGYRSRAHLLYLSTRLAEAVARVEAGQDARVVVSMPPRAGKSHLTSVFLVVWLLHKHPEWKIGLISHDPGLAVQWGRTVRNMLEEQAGKLGVSIAGDAGAAAEWQTTKRGGVTSRSVGQSVTGRGFKVLLIDDAVKDFADAHSATKRESLWNWWLANSQTRLEPPSLVVVIGTRWHEDDIIGRLLSDDHEGDPAEWEVIKFPAIAEDADVLGRKPGEPLISPLLDETSEEALVRWDGVRRSVGTYVWNALYQQRPSPAKGLIFNTDWWRFWTTNPNNVSRNDDGEPDGKVVFLDLEVDLAGARWLDSWDMAFKATSSSDYVVGQRWAQLGANRYLITQHRSRMSFTQTIFKMKEWSDGTVPFSDRVFERLVEDKANGTAVLDTLKEEISGLIPINPTESKEGRARSHTPTVEAGNVLIPYPGDPGNEWVADYLSEFREFPSGAHDDQVDATSQALNRMRTPQVGALTIPGREIALSPLRRGQVALAQHGRYSGMVPR